MKIIYLLLAIGLCIGSNETSAQDAWTWQELAPMPERISNNAVVSGEIDGQMFVYSFGGIDSTKTLQGISGHAMRLDVSANSWAYIPDLPDTLGKIAAAASTVNGVIYIMGGYHVLPGAPYEISSDRVHRFDPSSNTYLTDGAPIPVPIDDQVQVVWRDSLIYLVTGWSQTLNVPNVQIYDPAMDAWAVGTSVPNNAQFKTFGASGTIIGDTIYYNGGAAGGSFNSVAHLRKGVIDPSDPTQITWSLEGQNPGDKGYRMASVTVNEQAFWIGGSGVTYNYDGIAYNGSGGVEPLSRILGYDPVTATWDEGLGQAYGVMDLRGVAKIAANQVVVCGGMSAGQAVSNAAYLITYDGPNGLSVDQQTPFELLSQSVAISGSLEFRVGIPRTLEVHLIDLSGRRIGSQKLLPNGTRLTVSSLGVRSPGLYFLWIEGHSVPITIY